MTPKARWNALAHRMIGDTASLESLLDLVLALSDARDEDAFRRLLRVYPRLGFSERVDLLATLRQPSDGTPQHVAAWLKKLISMRNRLAHAWIVDATPEKAVFSSIYKGKQHDLPVFDVEMARAFRMIRESERSLRAMADQVGDTDLWGHLMGFDAQ